MITSNDSVNYAERWDRRRRKPLQELSEDEAHRRHGAGEEYVAVLSSGDRPVVVLTIIMRPGRPFTKVEFLDGRLLPRYAYTFMTPQEGGRDGWMFLSNIYEDELSDEAEPLRGKEVRFWPDGRSFMWDRDHEARTSDEGWAKELLDADELEQHWEPVPEFGRWSSIIRLDRSEAP
jgi:hypothetical protein